MIICEDINFFPVTLSQFVKPFGNFLFFYRSDWRDIWRARCPQPLDPQKKGDTLPYMAMHKTVVVGPKGWKLGLGHVPPAERAEAREQYLTREELRN